MVSEELGFPLAGSGEHVWLRVRKRGLNTDQVAGHLARHAGVSRRNVSYSGMKDRHAVTEQWFSAWLPRTEVADWQSGMPDGVEVVEHSRHSRKLQRGTHRANRFVITLRECVGEAPAIERRLAEIGRHGVPNYFGEQRFGRDGENVARAEAMFTGQEEVREAAGGSTHVKGRTSKASRASDSARGPRLDSRMESRVTAQGRADRDFGPIGDKHRRGIYLSAARSFLFNQVLAQRVTDGSWNRLLPGEAVMLDGKNSFFVEDGVNNELLERLDRHDIHPSGPLCGKGQLPSRGEARVLEEGVLSEHGPLADGLAAAGLRQERRALRLIPTGLTFQWPDATTLKLEFSLSRGCYATAVLRELANYQNAAGLSGTADSGD